MFRRITTLLVASCLLFSATGAALQHSAGTPEEPSVDPDRVHVRSQGDAGTVVVVDLPEVVPTDEVTQATVPLPDEAQAGDDQLVLTLDPNRLCQASGLTGPLWDAEADLTDGESAVEVPALPETGDVGKPSLPDLGDDIDEARSEVETLRAMIEQTQLADQPGAGDDALAEAQAWVDVAQQELEVADDRVGWLLEDAPGDDGDGGGEGRDDVPVGVVVSTGTATVALHEARQLLEETGPEDPQSQADQAVSSAREAWEEALAIVDTTEAEALERAREQGVDPTEPLGLWGVAFSALDTVQDEAGSQADPDEPSPPTVEELLVQAREQAPDEAEGPLDEVLEELDRVEGLLETLEEQIDRQTSTPAFEKAKKEVEGTRSAVDALTSDVEQARDEQTEAAVDTAWQQLQRAKPQLSNLVGTLEGALDSGDGGEEGDDGESANLEEAPDRVRIQIPAGQGPLGSADSPEETAEGTLEDPTGVAGGDGDGGGSSVGRSLDPCRDDGDGGTEDTDDTDDGTDDTDSGDTNETDDGSDGTGDSDGTDDTGDRSEDTEADTVNLAVDPGSATITEDEQATVTATVSNPSEGRHEYQLVAQDEGPIAVDTQGASEATLGAGESREFRLRISPTDDGSGEATVTASSSEGSSESATIPVDVEPTAGDLSVDVSSTAVELDADGTRTLDVVVENMGPASDRVSLEASPDEGVRASWDDEPSAELASGASESFGLTVDATAPGQTSVAVLVESADGAEIRPTVLVDVAGEEGPEQAPENEPEQSPELEGSNRSDANASERGTQEVSFPVLGALLAALAAASTRKRG